MSDANFVNSPSSSLISSTSQENNSSLGPLIDPRVHIELDRLNAATLTINQMETHLNDARLTFKQLLEESTQRIAEIRLQLGTCIEKSFPYYDARFQANDSLRCSQLAAVHYERANLAHSAAREMVYLAEQGLSGRKLDPAWQEMLNHATQRVNDAEKERITSEEEHKYACIKHATTNTRVKQLQKELKRAIATSSLSIRRSFLEMTSIATRHELMLLPYYEMKSQINHMLELQRNRVSNLENQLQTSKLTYADAMHNLEEISDEIHRTRILHQNLKSNAPREMSANTGASYVNDEFSQEFHKLNSFSTNCGLNLQRNSDIGNCCNSLITLKESESYSESKLKYNGQLSGNEWTEINLDIVSPEREHKDTIGENPAASSNEAGTTGIKQKMIRQNTLPNPQTENEYSSIKTKTKLEHNISHWILRSSIGKEDLEINNQRSTSPRPSLDNILGSTNEKMKEIFSQGMMILNISNLSNRKDDEKSSTLQDCQKKSLKNLQIPSQESGTHLNENDDTSDSESCSSTDMLSEGQISSLMLDKKWSVDCEQVLGTPLEEILSKSEILNHFNRNDKTPKP